MGQHWLTVSSLSQMLIILASLFTPVNAGDSSANLGVILPCALGGGLIVLCTGIWLCCCCNGSQQQGTTTATNQGVKYTVTRCQVVNFPGTNGTRVITTTDLAGGQTFVHPYTNVSYIPASVDGNAQPQPFPSGTQPVPTQGVHAVPTSRPADDLSLLTQPSVTQTPQRQKASHVFPNRWSKQGQQRNYNGFPSDFGQYQHHFKAPRAGPVLHLSASSGGESSYLVGTSSDSFPPSYSQLGFGTDWTTAPSEGIAMIGSSSGFSSSDAFGGDFNTSSTLGVGCDSGFSGGGCDSSGGGCDSGCGGGFSSCD